MAVCDERMSPEQLREWRARLGFTQGECARLIGVDHRSWQRWELGERHVPPPVQRLLHLIECQPGALARLRRLERR